MPPSKLSESDKQDILNLYQHYPETTASLASRYGVSNSTIIRVLKNLLGAAEYEALVQQKRAGRVEDSSTAEEQAGNGASELTLVDAESPSEEMLKRVSQEKLAAEPEPSTRHPEPFVEKKPQPKKARPVRDIAEQLPLLSSDLDQPTVEAVGSSQAASSLLSDWSADEITAVETELLSDLKHDTPALHDDEDDFDTDLEDLDEEDAETEGDLEDELEDDTLKVSIFSGVPLEVLPLTESQLPRTCYIVVDRTAELVTRPLKDFGELGQIPNQEEQHRILPIFDNHRVARRFSNRSQRIIKVPDGRMLCKAASHLQAKGITRLLIDGHVYALTQATVY